MDFQYLEYFIEIAKENNISKAAKKLFVTQSALNQQLLKIEKELGTQLFVRSPRNWRLTEAGEIYLEGCRKALLVKQDTYKRIWDITQSRASSLRVGLTPHRGIKMFMSIYPRLHQSFPNLTITPIELNAQAQREAASDGKIDLGFMVSPEELADAHTCIDLGQEEMVVLVPSSHPVCGRIPKREDALLPMLDLQELKDELFIMTRMGSSGTVLRELCDKIFADAGIVPRILMETSEPLHISNMVQTCMCCGIVPRYYAREDTDQVRCFVLKGHPSWHLYITYRRDAYLTLAAKEYIRLAQEYWKEHLILPQEP